MLKIITTADGSHTLFFQELNEHFHSVHGAIQESNHVFIKSGLDFCNANPVRIFEIGFGTGLNAFLSAIYSLNNGRKIIYYTIEKYPLNKALISSLNYRKAVQDKYSNLYDKIHACRWNAPEDITHTFTLLKIEGDLLTYSNKDYYDLIYFDAFGPDKQPEMWADEVIRKISEITTPGGIFVTYSVKGTVKRSLKKHGFNITLLPGPPGKRVILRAVKM